MLAYVCRNGSLRYLRKPMQSVADFSSRIVPSAQYAVAVRGRWGQRITIVMEKKRRSAALSSAVPSRVSA